MPEKYHEELDTSIKEDVNQTDLQTKYIETATPKEIRDYLLYCRENITKITDEKTKKYWQNEYWKISTKSESKLIEYLNDGKLLEQDGKKELEVAIDILKTCGSASKIWSFIHEYNVSKNIIHLPRIIQAAIGGIAYNIRLGDFKGIKPIIESLELSSSVMQDTKIASAVQYRVRWTLDIMVSHDAAVDDLKILIGLGCISTHEFQIIAQDILSEVLSKEKIEKYLNLMIINSILDGKWQINKELFQNSFTEIFQSNAGYHTKYFLDRIGDIPKYILQYSEPTLHLLEYQKIFSVIGALTYKKFIELREKNDFQGIEQFRKKIDSYIEELNNASKPASAELRNFPEYLDCLKNVYPKGNYSSVEFNVEHFKDRPEDLKDYQYPTLINNDNEQGYLLELSGLVGYKLKEGKERNPEFIAKFSQRIEKIQQFIQRFGPDKERLSHELDKLLDQRLAAFSQNNETNDQNANLSIHEKMAIYMFQAASRLNTLVKDQQAQKQEEINDLILTYHYALFADLNLYIQQTRDAVERTKDQVSQDYVLLSELNTIYGETSKHTLNNELFSKIQDSSAVQKSFEVFKQKMTAEKIASKQTEIETSTLTFKSDLEALLANTKIVNKADIINKKIKKDFSKNAPKELKEIIDKLLPKHLADTEDYLQLYKQIYDKKIELENSTSIPDILSNLINKDYQLTSQELAKYEIVLEEGKKDKKSAKKRNVRAFFSKTKETSNSRMVSHVCTAGNEEMWNNPNYFELIYFDVETKKCCGSTQILVIEDRGQKYFWIGPNPSENLLSKVSGQQIYDQTLKILSEFAKMNGFSGIVVPEESAIHGGCTNRDSEFVTVITNSILKDLSGLNKKINFESQHKLTEHYSYQNCRFVWENK